MTFFFINVILSETAEILVNADLPLLIHASTIPRGWLSYRCESTCPGDTCCPSIHHINSLCFRKEFEMDPEIKRQLTQQTQEKIETVKKEMAWEEEKHRIALHKLRMR